MRAPRAPHHRSRAPLALHLALAAAAAAAAVTGAAAAADAAAGGPGEEAAACPPGGGPGTCSSEGPAKPGGNKTADFWESLRQHGLQIRLRQKTFQEKKEKGRPARNRTGMVVTEDVFYGRPIVKVPRRALLSVETALPLELRQELQDLLFDKRTISKAYNITSEDALHLLSLAYPLIAHSRDPESVFREWLDLLKGERLTVLELSERQRRVLEGTTVEGAWEEMVRNQELIFHTAGNLSYFGSAPVSREEAKWALAVIMRHARVVHPHQDVRETRNPRMYLFPFKELVGVQLNPDVSVAISFQEEILLDGKREEEMVVQIARRDMPKGEEVFLWPGKLSNSEMAVRHGFMFPWNPVGIGRNITQPPNWDENQESNIRKEYAKYNCSSLEAFELRFSLSGSPSRSFIRCYRVSWFLTQGWYTPALVKRKRELEKWPPPPKYAKEDWLAWTQADQEVNRVLLEYCKDQRGRLKDTIDRSIAEDFRKSKDPLDKLVWQVRVQESKTFKECVNLATSLIT